MKRSTACEACCLWRDMVARAAPGQPCFKSREGAASRTCLPCEDAVGQAHVEGHAALGQRESHACRRRSQDYDVHLHSAASCLHW